MIDKINSEISKIVINVGSKKRAHVLAMHKTLVNKDHVLITSMTLLALGETIKTISWGRVLTI